MTTATVKNYLSATQRERLQLLANDVYFQAFDALDNEPNIDGVTAGKIAYAAQRAFEKSYQREMGADRS